MLNSSIREQNSIELNSGPLSDKIRAGILSREGNIWVRSRFVMVLLLLSRIGARANHLEKWSTRTSNPIYPEQWGRATKSIAINSKGLLVVILMVGGRMTLEGGLHFWHILHEVHLEQPSLPGDAKIMRSIN